MAEFQRALAKVQGDLKGLGQRMTAVGRTMTTRLTLPLAGLATGAIMAGSKFEASMSGVKAVTGATAEEMAKMTAQARELGERTEWSASQAGEGMKFLGMAGFEASEVLQAMPGLLDLATAGQLDLARASDIASNVLSGFGFEAGKIVRVGDVLAKTASSANTNIEQLGEAMSYVAPIASGLGVSLEETAGAIGILSNQGIQASRAGTGLMQVLNQLSAPTDQARTKLEAFGLTADQVNPEVHGLATVLQRFRDAGLGASDVMDMFGARAGTALIALLQAGKGSLEEFTESLQGAGGSAQEMADIMRDNVRGRFKELQSAVESASIAFFEVMAPAVEKVTEVLTQFARWLANLTPEAKKTFLTIATLLGVGGPVMLALGVFMTAISALVSPAGLVIAGLVALGLAWVNWGDQIKAVFAGVVDAVRGFIDRIIEFRDRITGVLDSIREKTVGVFTSMMDRAKGVVERGTGAIAGIWQKLSDTLVGHSIVPDMMDMINDVIDQGSTSVEIRVEEMAQKVAQSVEAVLSGIGGLAEASGSGFGSWYWDNIAESARISAQAINEVTSATAETSFAFNDLATRSDMWAQSLADGLAQAIVQGRDLLDVLKNIAMQLAQKALSRFIGGFLGIPLFHSGGVVGSDAPSGIRKFHSGGIIGANEVPAILKKGEGVFTPEQMKAMGGDEVHVTMNVNAVDAQSFIQLARTNKGVFESLIIENLMRDGAIRKAIKGVT